MQFSTPTSKRASDTITMTLTSRTSWILYKKRFGFGGGWHRGGVVVKFFREWLTPRLTEAEALVFPVFLEFIPIPRVPCLISLEYLDLSWFALLFLHSFALCCSPSPPRKGFLVSYSAVCVPCKEHLLLHATAWTIPGYLYFPILMGNRCLTPESFLIATLTCIERDGGIKQHVLKLLQGCTDP